MRRRDPCYGGALVTKLHASTVLAIGYLVAALLTGCHTPDPYQPPITTWEHTR